jgi:DNA-binding transcriptional MerR regulator
MEKLGRHGSEINPTRILSVRPLTREDLAQLALPQPRQGIVKQIRESHHDVARLVVSGLMNVEIAERTGYSLARIGQLMASPAFQELVATYRGKVNDTWLASHDEAYSTIHRATRKAWRMVEEQLDEADETNEKIPLKTLLAVAADGSDRVGYMKKSATLNANIDFAKRLEEAIARSKQPKLIEGEAA